MDAFEKSANLPFISIRLHVLPVTLFSLVLIVFSLVLLSVDVPLAHCKTLRVVVLTDAAGLGDKGFNDVCWKGAQEAAKDFGLKASFLQSREQADYVSNLSMAATNADVVVTLGFLFVDALKQVVGKFPDTRFVHIEGDVPADNMVCFDFRSEEGGFLAGLVAGLFSKSRKVGAVSGMDIPPVEAYVSGFLAGVRTAGALRKERIEPVVASAGSFNDPIKGKSLARSLMDQGIDVIFRVAGNTGVGVIEAVKGSEGVYLVAEDLDLDAELPGKVLTSALKRMDVAVYQALRDISGDNFHAGHQWLGAAQGAIDITDMKYSRDLFDALSLERIQKARELLKNGELSIPKRRSEVEGFQPPEL